MSAAAMISVTLMRLKARRAARLFWLYQVSWSSRRPRIGSSEKGGIGHGGLGAIVAVQRGE